MLAKKNTNGRLGNNLQQHNFIMPLYNLKFVGTIFLVLQFVLNFEIKIFISNYFPSTFENYLQQFYIVVFCIRNVDTANL